MAEFVLSRLIRMTITIFVIVTAVFFATRLSGNAIDFIIGEGITQEDRRILTVYYGLDASVWEQYWRYLGSFLDGQFGLSFHERRPVSTIFAERLGPTARLLACSILFTVAVSLPLGILGAVYRKSWIGSAVMAFAFLGYAIPNFVLATLLILVFAYTLNLLPVVGDATPWHFVMPTLALSLYLVAGLTRFTRNAMLDVLNQDYMRTARAKGLPERRVILKHGAKNASITVLSVIGLQVAGLAAAGNVVVESVFSWPGVGDLLVRAAILRDYPVLQFGVLAVSIAVILVNTTVDIAYAYADPRMRLRGR